MNKVFIIKNINNKKALKLLRKGGEKCLIIVDKQKRLLGTLSDGDLRKSILSSGFKGSIKNFYNKKPRFFYQDNLDLAKAKKYFLKENLTIIPIINKKTRKVSRVITPRILLKKFDENVELIFRTNDFLNIFEVTPRNISRKL